MPERQVREPGLDLLKVPEPEPEPEPVLLAWGRELKQELVPESGRLQAWGRPQGKR